MIIKLDWLKRSGACEAQAWAFRRLFDQECEITPSNVEMWIDDRFQRDYGPDLLWIVDRLSVLLRSSIKPANDHSLGWHIFDAHTGMVNNLTERGGVSYEEASAIAFLTICEEIDSL